MVHGPSMPSPNLLPAKATSRPKRSMCVYPTIPCRVGLSARAGEVMPRRFGGRVGCRDRGFLSADQKFRDRNPINFDPETGPVGNSTQPAWCLMGSVKIAIRIGCSDWSNSRSGAIGLRLGRVIRQGRDDQYANVCLTGSCPASPARCAMSPAGAGLGDRAREPSGWQMARRRPHRVM